MPARKKKENVPENINTQVKEILMQAAPLAALTLINALSEENLKNETRIDCAKEILNRIYGKTLQISDTDNKIQIVLAKDIKDLAE